MKKIKFIIPLILVALQISFAGTASEKFKQAMDAYHSGEYAEAYYVFSDFLKGYSLIDEKYAAAKYYSADALLNLGETEGAAAGFEFLTNNYRWTNFRHEALYKLGLIYFDQGKYAKSRGKLQLLLAGYPESDHTGSALYWIGESFTKEGKEEEAIKFLEEAVSSKRNNKFVDYSIYTLASTYEKIGDYKNAVKYYDQLLSYYPNSPLVPSAHIRIGISYFKLKEYQSSILELKNPELASLPEDIYSQSIYLLANSYYRVHDYKNAENAYREIIEKFPSSEFSREAKYGLGWSYFQQDKYSDAYNVFNSLSQGDDSIAVKSYYWKAEAKWYSGQNNEAFNLYKSFLDKYPENELASNAKYQMGVLYFDNNNMENAQKYLNSSALSSDNSVKVKALTLRGEIDLNKKEFTAAKNDFQTALDVPGIPPELQYRVELGLGVSYYYLSQYKDALAYLSDLSSKDPGFEKDKVNFYSAECNYGLGNYSNALKKYNAVDLSNPEVGSMALYGKAYTYLNLKDYSNSASLFSEFIKRYPNDNKKLDAQLRLADSYYGNKNFASASRVYKDIFNFDRSNMNDPNTYYQYAQALFKAGSSSEAITEFRNIQQKFPNTEYADRSLYVVGWINFKESNFKEAVASYRSVLRIYPNSSLGPIVYYSIGDAYFNIAKYDSAIINYQNVLTRYPASNYVFDAVNGIQYSYVAKNQPEKAIELIDNFVSKNPGVSFADQIFFKKGDIYYSEKKYSEAETSYKEFIAGFPKSRLIPEAYYWVGKSAENLNQDEEAIYNFKKVLNDYPKSESAAAAVIEIGSTYNNLKKYDSTLAVFNTAADALSKSPRLPEILFMKGTTLTNNKNFDDAYSVFAQLIQDYPASLFADKSKFELGLIELAANRYDNADSYFQNLAETRSDELGAKAQYYYGVSLFEQDNITDAITAFVRVRTIFSSYDEWLTKSYLKLGECYTKIKDFKNAKDIYRAVLSKHKGDDYGKEAQRKLREIE
jgi:TolA-binding protein